MINPDKQVSDMDTVANVAPSKGRRRLVKGAMLATPAVMTLTSGRLMAAVSATCPSKPVDPKVGLTTNPKFSPVYQLEVNPNNQNEIGYYDNGNFIVVPSGQQFAFHSATCWASVSP